MTKVCPLTRDELKELAESRHRKTWRGKDIKKLLPIPWTTRKVVYRCSNGWTIEQIDRKDAWLEGLLMGHCLGLMHGRGSWFDGMLSLRDTYGIPHVTLNGGIAVGRCNGEPPRKYMDLIYEYSKDACPQTGWGNDKDEDYHKSGVLTDRDYRDMPNCGDYLRDRDYIEKRKING